MPEAPHLPRPQLLRRGYLLALATITWNIIEGIVAVTCAGILEWQTSLIPPNPARRAFSP